MNRTESELSDGYRRSGMASITGDRKRHVVTMNPSHAGPGEDLYVNIPKLKESRCLVPGTLHLVFDMSVTGTKSHFMNNLSKLLQKRLLIRLAGEIVYDCTGESLYSVYKDLWKTNSERNNMVEYGICNANLRKLISNDDTGATSGSEEKVSDALVHRIFAKKQRIQLGRIMEDHGLYAPFKMNHNFTYVLTLPAANEALLAQSGETLGGYTLENLQLEYETIDNLTIANQISEGYDSSRSLSYEHITLMKTVVWPSNSTLINENINIPRKSMRAIVLLFTKQLRGDSEEYIYPNITQVRITVEGIANEIYSQGMPRSRFFDEAARLLSGKTNSDDYLTLQKFFKDKFALVIDLRTHQEKEKTGHGRSVVDTQQGILLEIKKTAHTGDLNCSLFVVSDGLVNLVNHDLHSIQY